MVNGDKNITVDTFFPETQINLTPEGNSVMKTIAGTEGIYKEVNGRYIFIYSDNNQFIQVDAPEEKLIEEVISK